MNEFTNKRLNRMSDKIDDITMDVHGLKQGLTSLNERFGELETYLYGLGAKIERMNKKMEIVK